MQSLPDFESTIIVEQQDVFRRHYASRRSQARAYLLTAATKALVLSEESEDIALLRSCSNEEAHMKSVILEDDMVRYFFQKASSKPGISCLKRGRSGSFRRISIRLKCKKDGSFVLQWRSAKLAAFKKEFSVQCEDMHVYYSFEEGEKKKGAPVLIKQKRGTPACKLTSFSDDPLPSDGVAHSTGHLIPFIRMSNRSRYIDLQFDSVVDTDAFVISMTRALETSNG